jgi:protein TonB
VSATAWPSGPDFSGIAALAGRLRARFGPIAAVIAAHALLFYVISSGLLARVAEVALPQVVDVIFVAPEPETPAPAPLAAPKTVALVQLPPAVVPPVPVIEVARPLDAITLPQAAPPPSSAPAESARAALASIPAPPQPAGPKTISSGVEYIQAPQPVYPSQSRRMGEQGKVVLRVLVNEKGQADQVLVQHSSGSARLDEAGRQAALRALFKPYVEDGRPVAVFVIVPLNFQLG